MKKYILIKILFLSISLLSFAEAVKWPILRGKYIDQKAPKSEAEIFMDKIICYSDSPQMSSAFSPNGDEFFYGVREKNNWQIFRTFIKDGKWKKPEKINFASSKYTDRDFTLSPDGTKILFGSNRPLKSGVQPSKRLHLFYSIKEGVNWSEPRSLGFSVNEHGGNYPSVSLSGNLYFFRCKKTKFKGCDIFMSSLKDGVYQTPVSLDSNINSDLNDWDSFIAPDESYIIFSSQNRIDSIGGQDLYISFKDPASGVWTKAANMGPCINSDSSEICPFVTKDNRAFFFTSRRRGYADIYWIDGKIIDRLKHQILNKKLK